jgi:hypothetical protein
MGDRRRSDDDEVCAIEWCVRYTPGAEDISSNPAKRATRAEALLRANDKRCAQALGTPHLPLRSARG